MIYEYVISITFTRSWHILTKHKITCVFPAVSLRAMRFCRFFPQLFNIITNARFNHHQAEAQTQLLFHSQVGTSARILHQSLPNCNLTWNSTLGIITSSHYWVVTQSGKFAAKVSLTRKLLIFRVGSRLQVFFLLTKKINIQISCFILVNF